VGERLGRVEQLLETLVTKISAYEQEENTQKVALTPDSMGNDVLTPFSSNGGSAMQDKSPFLSLFDNTVVSLTLAVRILQADNYRFVETINPTPPPLSKNPLEVGLHRVDLLR